jgi:hypothetical protein
MASTIVLLFVKHENNKRLVSSMDYLDGCSFEDYSMEIGDAFAVSIGATTPSTTPRRKA